MSKKLLKILPVAALLILLVIIGAGVYRKYMDHQRTAPLRNDLERIASEEYNAVFFSNFPTEHFNEEDFLLFSEKYLLKTSYCIPDIETLDNYFAKVAETWNEVDTVYLGVRPDIISAAELLNLVETWYDKQFTVIVAYPSMEYWTGLDEEKYLEKMAAYTDFINALMPIWSEDPSLQGRLSIRFYGADNWLVCNPANYEDDFNVNKGISYVITMRSANEIANKLTPENYESVLGDFAAMAEQYRTEPEEYPDLSNWDIVAFGDSVIAVEDTSSITGALSGLTGAHTYNLGRGGSSAAKYYSNGVNFGHTVSIFLDNNQDLLNNDFTRSELDNFYKNSQKDRNKCFIISYGLNDFFIGCPVSSDDPLDTRTYSGALRKGINRLQEAYPDAVFLLMTPNFTATFGNGLEEHSENGGLMPDYVAAAISLAEEKDTLLFDSYGKLGINAENHAEYLADGTHPNYSTRFDIAKRLARLLQTQVIEKN